MIRLGTKKDIPAIIDMARDFWVNTDFDDVFDPDQVAGMAEACIGQGLMVVLEVDGSVCGFCCGVMGPMLACGSSYMGSEMAWWVNPEHRRGGGGVGLLEAIEKQAKKMGCKYWNMVFMESSMPETVKGIYKEMGYKKTETSHTKRLT